MNRQMAKANTATDQSPNNNAASKGYGSNLYYPIDPSGNGNAAPADAMRPNQTYRRANLVAAGTGESHRDPNGSSIKQPSQSSYQPIAK